MNIVIVSLFIHCDVSHSDTSQCHCVTQSQCMNIVIEYDRMAANDVRVTSCFVDSGQK